MIRKALRKALISISKAKFIRYILQPEQLTVAEGWENYARNFKKKEGRHLGDEWNDPELVGADVPGDQLLSYLDERVFTPYLGHCDVLLELGCGGGRFTEILLPKCNTLIAADTSASMLRFLAERLPDNSKLDVLLLDGLGLSPIPDQSIDAAFSYGVFVHLQPWDIYNYLSELSRVLKPGGRAIIQHANTFSELGWRKFLNDDLPVSLNRHKPAATFSVMTPEIMAQFTQRAGLRLEESLTDVVRRDCISLISLPDDEHKRT